MKLIFIFPFIVAAIIIGPLLTIWALNTLFPWLCIPYTFWTWLAVAALQLQLFYKSSK